MGGTEIPILKFRTKRRALPMEAIDHGKPTGTNLKRYLARCVAFGRLPLRKTLPGILRFGIQP